MKTKPLCQLYGTLLDKEVFQRLGVKEGEYFGIFYLLQRYWNRKFPLGARYMLCAAPQLSKVLKTPDEWLEVGIRLADATALTYGKGSHSFVENAIPALVDGGLVQTAPELLRGIELVVETINPLGSGEFTFEILQRRVMEGQITTLDEIRHQRFTDADIADHKNWLHTRTEMY